MFFSRHSALAQHPLFTVQVERLSTDERVALTYKRAKLVLQTHDLSVLDIQNCSKKFWRFYTDPIISFDLALFTMLLAQVGLVLGTLSRHLDARPDLRPLINELLRFDKVGLFMLTERGHGTDAFNIETTATRMKDGSYILNTPREEASKFMPASTPIFGVPKVAVVMARLMENGKDLGHRHFIVPICNEREMFRGITSSRLPTRSGTSPLDFAITSFRNVRLPATALVSPTPFQITAPTNPLASWWDENWRIQHGTLLIAGPLLHGIKISAYIAAVYSMNRRITDRQNVPKPIFDFRTQQWPIASAVAASSVYEIFYESAIRYSKDLERPQHIRHAMAVITKTTIISYFLRTLPELAERLGAQGTFEPNFIARMQNDGVGGAIGEGELMTLSIRLLSELLLGRYSINLPPSGESLLSRHAHSLLDENTQLLAKFGGHRTAEFHSIILPQSRAVIEAIGHALAYSAALKDNLPQPLLDMFECAVIRQDPAWYCEAGIGRLEQRVREDRAISSMLPDMKVYLANLNVEDLITAPIESDESWKKYAAGLPTYSGRAFSEDAIPTARL
ncbi:Acyl-CoA oxidase [Mycena venus]|uniref:Acyl-CoA oxidase n=1 Tax=Mycena venus TaxID=2733690 RepID=A0A8H7CH31_9AGAR|nr:Acyl-CoA oxidase [Mycena venus]